MREREVILRKKNAVVICFNDDPTKGEGNIGYYGKLYRNGVHVNDTYVHGETEVAITTVLEGARIFFGDEEYEIVR
jgi:hypothetical protein